MRWRLALLALQAFIAGCSDLKTYPGSLDKNLSIRTGIKSGSALSTVRAAVHIHRANAKCETEYLGTVELSESLTKVGVPPDQLSYLVFSFASSSLLGSSTSTMRYETLLRPRAGYGYDIHVSYADDFYDVAIREIDPRRSSAREVRRQSLKACGSR